MLNLKLKTYKPVTSSQRGLVLVSKRTLYKGDPEKTLVFGKKKISGRNSLGRICVRGRGGGNKRKIRIIDFHRKAGQQGVVSRFEYDPGRSACIALVESVLEHDKGRLYYIIAPQGLSEGDTVSSGSNVPMTPGNALPIVNIHPGVSIHNIEFTPGKGAGLVRSAGASARITGRDDKYTIIRLSSGEIRRIPNECYATVGVVSNQYHQNIKLAKAGRSRWRGHKSHVRGVAMNPIDHPHGGGNGKTSGGRHPVSYSCVPTKGKRTVNHKKGKFYVVRSRHQERKK